MQIFLCVAWFCSLLLSFTGLLLFLLGGYFYLFGILRGPLGKCIYFTSQTREVLTIICSTSYFSILFSFLSWNFILLSWLLLLLLINISNFVHFLTRFYIPFVLMLCILSLRELILFSASSILLLSPVTIFSSSFVYI